MAVAGNTVRLRVEFKTFDDVYADPSTITLKIYNKTGAQVGTTVSITASHKVDTGIYQYDYTIPTGYTSLQAQFAGTLEDTALLAKYDIDIT